MKKHKCFISFKTKDIEYKEKIQNELDVDMIDKSLNEPIDSHDPEYIIRKIREDYLKDSTVTIFLIGEYSAESSLNALFEDQQFIKRELQASLSKIPNDIRNGLLGIALPSMYDRIYKGNFYCENCQKNHRSVEINDDTTIKEFNKNYYIENKNLCAWGDDDRYAILVKWDDFKKDPNKYIDEAYDKRTDPISEKVTSRPK